MNNSLKPLSRAIITSFIVASFLIPSLSYSQTLNTSSQDQVAAIAAQLDTIKDLFNALLRKLSGTLGAQVSGGSSLATDTFTDTNNVLLQNHTADSGQAWMRHPLYSNNAIISGNSVRDQNGTSPVYYLNITPSTAEYDIQMDVTGTGYVGGPAGRISITADTYYFIDWAPSSWRLNRTVNGSNTVIGSYSGDSPSGSVRTVRFEVKNATKKVFINGVERISSTDNNITAVGKPGIVFSGVTSDTGDNFIVTESGGTTPPPPPDTTAPTAPANPSATAVSSSQINLSWTPSSDNTGVTGYNIYRNNVQIASVASTSYNDTGLTASTLYTYYIQATDAAGNISTQSTFASATTQNTTTPPPTPAPTVSLSASPTSVTYGNSATLSWSSTNATSCTASGVWSGTKATSGSQTLTNLTTTGTYTLSCTGSGGTIAQSVTVTSTPPPISTDCSTTSVRCVDDTAGSTQEYGTIQAAVNAAVAGDTVLVHDGTYQGFNLKSKSGTISNPIIIRGVGRAFINSNEPGGSGELIYTTFAGYFTIENFEVDCTTGTSWCIGIHSGGTTPNRGIVIRGNKVYNGQSTNIYLSHAADSLIENNITYGSRASHGIYLANGGSDNTIIRGNIAYNNTKNGLHLNGDISVGGDGYHTGILVENNIFYNNTANGMDIDGAGDSTFQNNLMYGNGANGLRAFAIDAAKGPQNLKIMNNTIITPGSGVPVKLSEDLGGHTIFNNILIAGGSNGSLVTANTNFKSANNAVAGSFSSNGGNTLVSLASWQASGYDANSFTTTSSALFTNPAGANYTLKAGAPAIDKGTSSFNAVSAPALDILLVSRQGVVYDIGAYEYASGSTTPPPTPTPTVSLSASPTSVTSGGSSTLTWSSTNATSCTASGAWSGTKATSGSQTLTNLTTTGTYTLSCTGSGGTTSQSTTINVTGTTPPPSSTKFSLNDRVQVSSGPLNVRPTASATGTLLGQQQVNALGTVIGGPVSADGFNWWNVNYDTGADGWSAEDYLVKYTTTTPPPSTDSFMFTASGDIGAKPETTVTLQNMLAQNGALTLFLGDLSYNQLSPESAWCDYVKGIFGATYPVMLEAGNHEDETGDGALITEFTKCLPDRIGVTGTYGAEYYFDYPQTNPLARFIMLPAGMKDYPKYENGSASQQWLGSVIDQARAANIKWIIVGMHMLCPTMGEKNCQTWNASPGPDLFNFLVSKKVDLVLHGHDHNYQRSKQFALGPSCTSIPVQSDATPNAAANLNCIVDSGDALTKGAGTVIVISGITPNYQWPYELFLNDPEAPYFKKSQNDNYGYTKVTLSDNQLFAQFVATGKSYSGAASFTDSFTISSSGTTPPPTPVPTVTLSASPTSVTSGGSSTLTWSSTNSTSCTGSGAWSGTKATSGSQTLTNLTTTGTYTLSCTGSGGTTSQSVTVTVTATSDTTIPAQPANFTATAVSSSQINLSWTASTDNVGVTGYDIYRNNTFLTITTGTTYSNTGLASNTAYSYYVRAKDAVGNQSNPSTTVSATTLLASDTTVPIVSITSPTVSTTVSGTVTVSASAFDPVIAGQTSTGIAGVQFKLDGANLGTEDITSPYSVSWNTTSATNGTHTLSAVARDAAGNQATAGTITVTVNNVVAPSPDTTAPSQPTNVTGAAISSSQVNLTWTASTDLVVSGQITSGIANYQVFRCTGTTCTPSTTPLATATSNSFNNTGLSANTTYRYRVRAVDVATNVSAYSSIVTVTTQVTPPPTDTTLPTVSMSSPASNATVFSTVTVSAAAADNVGIAGVQFKLDGANLGTEDTTSPYSVSWNTTSATNGTHTLSAVARDAAGNQATANARTVTVSNAVPDTTNPTITITTPTNGTTYTTASPSVTLGGSASDNIGITQVSWDSTQGAQGTALGTTSWSTTITLQSGANTITVTARDQAGNTGTDTIIVTYTPAVSDTTKPSSPQNLTTSSVSTNQVTLTWTPSTDNVGVTGYRLIANGTLITTITETTYTHTNLSPGTSYTYTIEAVDAAGNVSLPGNAFTVTTATAPAPQPPTSGGGGSSPPSSGGTGTTSSGGVVTPPSTSTTPPQMTTTTTTGGGTTTTPTQIFATLTGPFSIGISNDQVKLLQQMLIKDGSLGGVATGYYGPLTQRAVETFQIKYNLVTSGSPGTTGFGLAGPGTRAKLNSLYAGGSAGGMTTSTDREALLASLRKQVADLIVILQGLITKLAALKAAQGVAN